MDQSGNNNNSALNTGTITLNDIGNGEGADEESNVEHEGDFIGNTKAAPSAPESSKLGFVFWVLGVFNFVPAIGFLTDGNLFKCAASTGTALSCLVVAAVLNFLAKIASRLERINNTFEAVLTSAKTCRD
jgi:hypothetical protein